MNNGNGKTSRLKLTSNMQVWQLCKLAALSLDLFAIGSRAKDGIHLTSALRGTVLVCDSNVDESAKESNVENNGDK